MAAMIVGKILSNNAVLLTNARNEEVVAIGRGIGFGKKPGDSVEDSEIESQFVKKSEGLADVFSQLLAEIPPALSDHINFALQRHANGLTIKNFLLWDIKRFYAEEFAVGLEALGLIEQALSISLPQDEAGFIALHLANAKNNSDMQSTMHSATIIKDVLSILQYDLKLTYDEESLDYQRFVTHLKFFALRLLNRKTVTHGDDSIYQGITEMMPTAWACAKKIGYYVDKNYGCQLTTDEVMFLTIHINRLSGG